MPFRNESVSTTLILVCLFVAPGCGGSDLPELGEVTGHVTMDGQPLAGVIVYFKPEEGRAATAVTDSEGNFELVYSYGVGGSKVGASTVSFEWPLGKAGVPIPQKYAPGRSSIKKEVKPGENKFTFELHSQ